MKLNQYVIFLDVRNSRIVPNCNVTRYIKFDVALCSLMVNVQKQVYKQEIFSTDSFDGATYENNNEFTQQRAGKDKNR